MSESEIDLDRWFFEFENSKSADFDNIFATLDAFERRVLKLRFGLDDHHFYSPLDIVRIYRAKKPPQHITEEMIDAIEQKARQIIAAHEASKAA